MTDIANNLTLPKLKFLGYLSTDVLRRYNLDNAKHLNNAIHPLKKIASFLGLLNILSNNLKVVHGFLKLV